MFINPIVFFKERILKYHLILYFFLGLFEQAYASEENKATNKEVRLAFYTSKYQNLAVGDIISISEESLVNASILFSGFFGSRPEVGYSYRIDEIKSLKDSVLHDWLQENFFSASLTGDPRFNIDSSEVKVYSFDFVDIEEADELSDFSNSRKLSRPSFFITSKGDIFGCILYAGRSKGPFWLGFLK